MGKNSHQVGQAGAAAVTKTTTTTLWFDSRELLDETEASYSAGHSIQDELGAFSRLLEAQAISTRGKLYSNLIHETSLFRDSATPKFVKRRFKPIHQAEPHEEVPIFRQNVSTSTRNLTAELILKLQDKLMKQVERIADMDERVCRVSYQLLSDGCCNSSELQTRLGSNEIDGTQLNEAKDKEEPHCRWSASLSRVVWFAWPIFLISALDKYWPRCGATQVD